MGVLPRLNALLRALAPLAAALACAAASAETSGKPAAAGAAPSDWPHYGGDAGGARFSSLAQLDRTNVGGLEEAWRIRTGELDAEPPPPRHMMRAGTGSLKRPRQPMIISGRLGCWWRNMEAWRRVQARRPLKLSNTPRQPAKHPRKPAG